MPSQMHPRQTMKKKQSGGSFEIGPSIPTDVQRPTTTLPQRPHKPRSSTVSQAWAPQQPVTDAWKYRSYQPKDARPLDTFSARSSTNSVFDQASRPSSDMAVSSSKSSIAEIADSPPTWSSNPTNLNRHSATKPIKESNPLHSKSTAIPIIAEEATVLPGAKSQNIHYWAGQHNHEGSATTHMRNSLQTLSIPAPHTFTTTPNAASHAETSPPPPFPHRRTRPSPSALSQPLHSPVLPADTARNPFASIPIPAHPYSARRARSSPPDSRSALDTSAAEVAGLRHQYENAGTAPTNLVVESKREALREPVVGRKEEKPLPPVRPGRGDVDPQGEERRRKRGINRMFEWGKKNLTS